MFRNKYGCYHRNYRKNTIRSLLSLSEPTFVKTSVDDESKTCDADSSGPSSIPWNTVAAGTLGSRFRSRKSYTWFKAEWAGSGAAACCGAAPASTATPGQVLAGSAGTLS